MGACCSSCLRQRPRLTSSSSTAKHRRRHGRRNKNTGSPNQGQFHREEKDSLTASLCSDEVDDDFHSCQDAFSFEGSPTRMSLESTLPPSMRPAYLSSSHRHSLDALAPPPSGAAQSPPPASSSSDPSEGSETHSPTQGTSPGCLPDILSHALSLGGGTLGSGKTRAAAAAAAATAAAAAAAAPGDAVEDGAPRVDAGASLEFREPSPDEAPSVSMCCEDADSTHFKVRGLDYATSRVKVTSPPALYELVAADLFSFESKQSHIAQMVNLPPAGASGPTTPGGTEIPPLLIINIQMPTYAPFLFGRSDGPGCSFVFYFRLREGFDPSTFSNQKALQLFERFLLDGTEADGHQTRERFKLIGRVVNVEEWSKQGPLSGTEKSLLTAYNEKPLLTRPQHHFHRGANYLEVDIDIHAYSYIAKKAFQGYVGRLGPVVWENAFVVQGNSVDELPEQVLAAGRIYRADLTNLRPFSSYLPQASAPQASA